VEMTESNRQIDLQAAEWAVRLDAGPLTADEQAEFDDWLAANARHRGALLHWRASVVDVQRLAALAGHQRPFATDAHSASGGAPKPRAFYDGFTSRRWFMTASIAALAVTGVGAWWTVGRRKVYVSDIGEVRRVALADGSTMVLNTATEATVNFDKTRREIELTKGEGLFEVAKDAARPFIVRAGPVAVRAVGTVFSVRSFDQQVNVTVTEGVVELTENGGRADGRVGQRVAANESATVMETHQVEVQSIRHEEAERRLAWRDGMLAFAGETLASAVDEINRHNHRRVVIDGAELAGRRVDGLFRANDPDGFAATVAAALGAQRIDQDDAIHLRSRFAE
jgi:transmembrane sensor